MLDFTGYSVGTSNVYDWERSEDSKSCIMEVLQVNDGVVLYPTVKCINNVQLSSHSNIEPLTISYMKPSSVSASLNFIPNNVMSADHEASANVVQSNSTYVTFNWEGFYDNTGTLEYETQISSTENILYPWSNNRGKTFRSHLIRANAKVVHEIMVEVRSRNAGGKMSDVVNNTICIQAAKPSLTGTCMILNLGKCPGPLFSTHVCNHFLQFKQVAVT